MLARRSSTSMFLIVSDFQTLLNGSVNINPSTYGGGTQIIEKHQKLIQSLIVLPRLTIGNTAKRSLSAKQMHQSAACAWITCCFISLALLITANNLTHAIASMTAQDSSRIVCIVRSVKHCSENEEGIRFDRVP